MAASAAMALIGPVIHRLEKERLLDCARVIRDCPHDTPDRLDEARRLLRRVMLDSSVGKVSDAVRRSVLEILAFALDMDALAVCVRPVRLTLELEPTDIDPSPAPATDS